MCGSGSTSARPLAIGWPALDKRLLPGGVQHDDARLQRKRGKLAEVVADPQSLGWNVGVAADRRVDRDEIVLAGELHAVAR